MYVKADIVGAKELEAALKALPKTVANKVVRKALRSGGKVILGAMKAKCPVETGALLKALKVRAGRRRRNSYTIVVGASSKDFTGKQFYASFVEMGHLQGSRKLGSNRKMIPAKPFMRPAYEQSKDTATTQTLDELKSGIEQAAANGGK